MLGGGECAKVLGYLSERRGQMRYGEYRSHGLPIGSERVKATLQEQLLARYALAKEHQKR